MPSRRVEKFEPCDQDRGAVEGMAFAGVTQVAIAEFLDISVETLRKYFREELDRAPALRIAKVAQANYERATGFDPETGAYDSKNSNVLAQMFILKNQPSKTREKWNETVLHHHEGEIVHRPDDRELGRRLALALSRADAIDGGELEVLDAVDEKGPNDNVVDEKELRKEG